MQISKSSYLWVEAVSPRIVPGDIHGNMKKVKEALENATSDLVVLPESVLSGVTLTDPLVSVLSEKTEECIADLWDFLKSSDSLPDFVILGAKTWDWVTVRPVNLILVLSRHLDSIHFYSNDTTEVPGMTYLKDGLLLIAGSDSGTMFSLGLGFGEDGPIPGADVTVRLGRAMRYESKKVRRLVETCERPVIYCGPWEAAGSEFYTGLVKVCPVHSQKPVETTTKDVSRVRQFIDLDQFKTEPCTHDVLKVMVQEMTERHPEPVWPKDPWPISEETLVTQAIGLLGRMHQVPNIKGLVLGLSGGSDSAWAAIVAIKALKMFGLPKTALKTVWMGGPGSTPQSHALATALAAELGSTHVEVDITDTVETFLDSVDHPRDQYDVTFENVQARARMMCLFGAANSGDLLVVGTSDLSEIALGWSTFGGDHLSSYNPNAGLPKTALLGHLRQHSDQYPTIAKIADRAASPELVPGGNQVSEEVLGSYQLTDFFLYHLLSHGWSPSKIVREAAKSFGVPEESVKERWNSLIGRLGSSQFKRSCSPDGPRLFEQSLDTLELSTGFDLSGLTL